MTPTLNAERLKEEWRPCDDDAYEVSSLGQVRRAKPSRPGFIRVGRILKHNIVRGYACVRLSGAKDRKVADLVARAFIGPKPDGLEINHKNGVKTDNRPENLEYVTKSENVRHAIRMGLYRNGRARLTREQAEEIRRRRSSGEKSADLAREFGVGVNHVWDIWRGNSWAAPVAEAKRVLGEK